MDWIAFPRFAADMADISNAAAYLITTPCSPTHRESLPSYLNVMLKNIIPPTTMKEAIQVQLMSPSAKHGIIGRN